MIRYFGRPTLRGLSSRVPLINCVIWLLPRWEGWQDFDNDVRSINTLYTNNFWLFISSGYQKEMGLSVVCTINSKSIILHKQMKTPIWSNSRSFILIFMQSQLNGWHYVFIAHSDKIDFILNGVIYWSISNHFPLSLFYAATFESDKDGNRKFNCPKI